MDNQRDHEPKKQFSLTRAALNTCERAGSNSASVMNTSATSIWALKQAFFLAVIAVLTCAARAGEIHEAAKAGDTNKFRALLSADPSAVNQQDSDGNTAIHVAIRANNRAIVELSLAFNPDLQIKNNSGWTPLKLAQGYGRTEVVTLLEGGTSVVIATNLQKIKGGIQEVNPATGLPVAVPVTVSVTDMYHYTEAQEQELQAAIIKCNLLQSEYQNLAQDISFISFKALDTGVDGCRIEMDGDDYYLFGFKAQSDRFYSRLAVGKTSNYTYETVNKSRRTIPSFTVCSPTELDNLARKRLQVEQAKSNYGKLLATKTIITGNERALKSNLISAEKSEAYGMQRMAERYRNGEGVEKDLAKANNLFKKAEEATLEDNKHLLEANQIRDQASAKLRFQRLLQFADKGDYRSLANLARCYRDGIGTEKDLNKALEHFEKCKLLMQNAATVHSDSYQSEIDDIKKQIAPSAR